MMDFETAEVVREKAIEAIVTAFSEVKTGIERGPSLMEIQRNKKAKTPVSTGVQNVLIRLLIEIARKLGLNENELEQVFEEVLKMIAKYKDKRAEN